MEKINKAAQWFRLEVLKANNFVQDWHYLFKQQIPASYPSKGKFMEGLKQGQRLQEVRF